MSITRNAPRINLNFVNNSVVCVEYTEENLRKAFECLQREKGLEKFLGLFGEETWIKAKELYLVQVWDPAAMDTSIEDEEYAAKERKESEGY